VAGELGGVPAHFLIGNRDAGTLPADWTNRLAVKNAAAGKPPTELQRTNLVRAYWTLTQLPSGFGQWVEDGMRTG
jgi:hypothetical protein